MAKEKKELKVEIEIPEGVTIEINKEMVKTSLNFQSIWLLLLTMSSTRFVEPSVHPTTTSISHQKAEGFPCPAQRIR